MLNPVKAFEVLNVFVLGDNQPKNWSDSYYTDVRSKAEQTKYTYLRKNSMLTKPVPSSRRKE